MTMIVVMIMIVGVAVVATAFLFDVLQPKFWYSAADNATNVAHARENVAQVVFDVAVQTEEEDFGGGAYERDRAGEDKDGDNERGDGIPSRPAGDLDENS